MLHVVSCTADKDIKDSSVSLGLHAADQTTCRPRLPLNTDFLDHFPHGGESLDVSHLEFNCESLPCYFRKLKKSCSSETFGPFMDQVLIHKKNLNLTF